MPVPDLWFEVSTDSGEKDSENYELNYNLQSQTLQIEAFQLPSNPRFWRSNNKITAVPDLSNAQLAIQIDNTMVPTLPQHGQLDETGQTLSKLRSQMRLGTVTLRISTRELWLNRHSKMTRLTASGPRPFAVYTTVLPKSLDQLQLP
jgi:hypothetical protein